MIGPLPYKKVGPENSKPLLFLQAQGDGDHNPLWSGALEHRVVDECGRLAQLVAASPLHGEGRGSESLTAHHNRLTFVAPQTVQRILDYSCPEPMTGCWLWLGYLDPNGYGRITHFGKPRLAHQVSYIHFRGPVPLGLELDHLCRLRCCINPFHLEAVTHAENMRRGVTGIETGRKNRAKTACPRGHDLLGANLFVHIRKDGPHRSCRTCRNIAARDHKRRLRAAFLAANGAHANFPVGVSA